MFLRQIQSVLKKQVAINDSQTILKRNKSAAFTLVELVVVITILAILGTIGFLSVGGYSSRARDSERVADVATLAKSLDLSIVTVGSYPTPDNSFSVTYSGGVLWYQWTIGSSVIQKLHTSIPGGGIDGKPVDPLKNTDYTYSTLAETKAYQIKADYENDLGQVALGSFDTAYAAPGSPTIAYVRGNFGGLTAKTTTGSMTYVLAVPSILTNTGTAGAAIDISGTALTGTLVFNGKNLTGASSFNPNIVVYSGSTLPKDTSSAQFNTVATSIATALKTAYAGTDIASNSAVATLIATPAGSLGTFGASILTGQLGVSGGGGGGDNNQVETPLYTFASHTFTVCWATGQNGPSLATCRSSYGAGIPWTQDTTNNYLNMSTNGIQEWKVPATGTYTIDTYGAKGGQGSSVGNAGGFGTRMKGDFSLTKWEVIQILVGHVGPTAASNDGAGGGGTFVVRKTGTVPLVIAGGGGGGSYNGSYGMGMNASTSTSGTPGTYGDGVGGTGGSGGVPASGAHSAPGGGLTGTGGIAPSTSLVGGAPFTSGGTGGTGNSLHGGFGGGGGTNGGGWGGGGGGGYSGGGTSSSSQYGGGGGGSYNSGTNQTNTAGAGSGNGSVIITKL